MRIRVCMLWKAIACLLVISWFTFSFLRMFHLSRSDGAAYPFDDFEIPSNNCRESVWYQSGNDTSQQQQQWQQMQWQILSEWRYEAATFCSANVVTLQTVGCASLQKVIFDPSQASGRFGGEDIQKVLNQPESSEYWTLKRGLFQVLCPNVTPGHGLMDVLGRLDAARPHTVLRQFLAATITMDQNQFAGQSRTADPLPGPVLAVIRHEYANLYHTVALLYNAFANAIYSGIDPAMATVLLVDGHPRGALDPLWSTLFRRVIRIGQLSRSRSLDSLVWVAEGHESPMLQNRPTLPLVEQFSQFVLTRHGAAPQAEPPATPAAKQCIGSQVVLIWRRDYLAHPRNPLGRVMRKISNEDQILTEARGAFPELALNVTGVVMESLTIQEQLNLIARTRVLIGMHGAGLAHAVFLPKSSGLIELFPDRWSQENFHFRSIAGWRGLAYEQWVSGMGDGNLPIVVPVGVIARLMRGLLNKLGCL